MKKCPLCEMVVDAYNECPVCGADITGESFAESEIEHYRINRWFFLYLIKRHKFLLICTLFVLLLILTSLTTFDKYSFLSLLLTVCMWVEVLYKNLVFKLFGSIYSEGFLEITHAFSRYAYGIFGIVFAFIGRLV